MLKVLVLALQQEHVFSVVDWVTFSLRHFGQLLCRSIKTHNNSIH